MPLRDVIAKDVDKLLLNVSSQKWEFYVSKKIFLLAKLQSKNIREAELESL